MESAKKSGGQAALRSGSCVCGCDLNFGYQRRNRSSRSSLRILVLVCSKRRAPRKNKPLLSYLLRAFLGSRVKIPLIKGIATSGRKQSERVGPLPIHRVKSLAGQHQQVKFVEHDGGARKVIGSSIDVEYSPFS